MPRKATTKKEKAEVGLIPTEEIPEVRSDPIALMSAKNLEAQMGVETEKRKLIKDYISKHLVRGIDYGQIHIAKNCPNKYNCKNEYHFSKDVLFKPGAEKFSSLFKLRAEFKKDTETWEMLGSSPGTVAYLCQLYTANNILVGEGRGVASISEKGSPNTAVKIAEKRAKMDAILATGALSDFFTQDLEDMQPDADLEVEDEGPKSPVDVDEPPAIDSKPAHDAKTTQRMQIVGLCEKLGIKLTEVTKEEIKKLTGIDAAESNYPQIIDRLKILIQERKENKKSE